MSFQISPEVDGNKVFLVQSSEIEGRLDPAYNLALVKNKINSCFKKERIGKICRALSGGTPSKSNSSFWTGSIPWVSPKDMKRFYLNETEDHITEKAVVESSTNIAPKNSVLIVFRSGILQHTIPVAVTTKQMAINQDIKALIFKKTVIPSYIGYFFNVYQIKLIPLFVKHSTTVQSINTAQFDRFEIPIPPHEIQSAIVAKMDAAYAAKKEKETEAERLLNSIDDYLLRELGIELPEQEENTVQSRIFTRRFSEISGGRFDPNTYKKERIEVIERIKKGQYTAKPLYQVLTHLNSRTGNIDRETIYIGMENIEGNTGEWIPTESKESVSSATVFKKKDILFPKLRPYLNKVFYSDTEGVCSTEFHVFSAQNDNNEYISNFLRSRAVVAQTKCLMSGNTLPRLQFEDIQKLLIPLPPLPKQTEIADHITRIRNNAKQLKQEAKQGLEQAKQEVEAMILGEDSSDA
ncbi:MAG: restriction endonuclease subunit S [Candidatus Electrothrix sp. AUS3]|nr:restriction endonuclease subunit S [Candidatus Electrothrix gigas]